jgi:DNA-directed RNA polymerase I subunit RPA2
MGKQTMGTPCHAYQRRADNKLYRILTPQSPLVRPQTHEKYLIDEFPMGTNAIVAVISATVSNSWNLNHCFSSVKV